MDETERMRMDGSSIIRYTPVVSGSISIFCSSLIIYPILRQKRLNKAFHRILLSLSVVDIFMSLRFLVFAFILDPEDSEPSTLCTLNGLLTMISVSAPLYNGALSIYFLLYIRFGMSENYFRKKVEIYLHAFCLFYPIVLAFAGVYLKVYNPSHNAGAGNCVAEKYPINCGSDNLPCERGQAAELFVWLSIGIPLSLVFLLLIINNYIIFKFVQRLEKISEKFQFHNFQRRYSDVSAVTARLGQKVQRPRSKTDMVAKQSSLYVFAFFISWIWTLITRSLNLVHNSNTTAFFIIEVVKEIFLPMQGLFNFLVYVRPKYNSWRRTFPDKPFFWICKMAVFCSKSSEAHRDSIHIVNKESLQDSSVFPEKIPSPLNVQIFLGDNEVICSDESLSLECMESYYEAEYKHDSDPRIIGNA